MTQLVDQLRAELARHPRQFSELVDAYRHVSWRTFLKAWGALRAENVLKRDEDGNYIL
jgi:hypothetical protein